MWGYSVFTVGDLIDGRFRVVRPFEKTGGMGTLLYVDDTAGVLSGELLLKYCHLTDPRTLERFKREIRLLASFQGNSRVVQVLAFNPDHDPPYYVMPHYARGDITRLVGSKNYELHEVMFNNMLDCIAELHTRGTLHRDIKPQNFLIDISGLVVSDFGLGTELDSQTEFTKSSEWWGTPGYMPPECFNHGGFRDADERADIFMLGKTFYVLLSKRGPAYLVPDDIPDPLFAVIERCCAPNIASRYKTLADLRQSLKAAFDIVLNRSHGPGKAGQMLALIQDRLNKERKYDTGQVIAFVEQLAMQETEDRIQICFGMRQPFFHVMRQGRCVAHLSTLLNVYRQMAEDGMYSFEFAEVVASNMSVVFDGNEVPDALKAEALETAIISAVRQNRFAAMDSCVAMIRGVTSDGLAVRVRDLLLKYADEHFIENIERSTCKNDAIRQALREIKEAKDAERVAVQADPDDPWASFLKQ